MDRPIHIGRNRCSIEDLHEGLFISLVDYRNNLFLSNNESKILQFYGSFESVEQMIRWMKERPKGATYIHEVPGNKDVIIVIPTADFEGEYAKSCREDIFSGFHIIFVESGEVPDSYFNYAHNCNLGIRKAREYNPTWIVVSNDDKVKVMDPSVLLSELLKLDEENIDIAIPNNNEVSYICRKNLLVDRILTRFHNLEKSTQIERRFLVKYKWYGKEESIFKRIIQKLFFKVLLKTELPGSFIIIRSTLCDNLGYDIFDETYQNGMEDLDLFMRFYTHSYGYSFIDYVIHDKGGSSLGRDKMRYKFRGILNRSYFNFKNSDLLSKLDKGPMVIYGSK